MSLFRSFQPFLNPLGFGASDFLELALAGFLVAAVLLWPRMEPAIGRLALGTKWCMLLLALLPVVLRLALLPAHPIPTPDLYDEFSHLLVADTLRHFRLANPAHAMHSFFETFFVLQDPSYASIYPIGQGVALASGRAIFGHPWAGVVLSVALFCALLYWMLRAWTTPGWALLGGMLAVIQFGPLNQWMNSYWGGAVSACAGCLVFGALPRLRASKRTRDAVILGTGLGIQLLARPWESILLFLAALIFLAPAWREYRCFAIAGLACLPAVGLTLLHDRQVTGEWMTLPGILSRYQYGVPTTFTFQPLPVPHRELTREQRLGYDQQVAYHGVESETPGGYFRRFLGRLHFYRFLLPAPMFLALIAFIPSLRHLRFAWLAATLAIFALGSNFYPFFFPHYIAAVAPLFVLAALTGLGNLPRHAAFLIVSISAAIFLLWYGLHLFEDPREPLPILRYETGDVLNHANPERRILIRDRLSLEPGKLLVFVRYWPNHIFQDEWVYNEADIDSARIVWARDSGPANEKLRRYYPDRTVWLLEPDARPPKLTPYPEEPKPEPAPVLTPVTPKPPSQPTLRFEDVPKAR